jgi:hypothetical protein
MKNMDYKKELKKMARSRRRYRPVMRRLLELGSGAAGTDFPMNLIDDRDVLVILELIDVGYLDENALRARRRFGEITALVYTGDYPFTEGGEYFYKGHGAAFMERIINTFRRFF